jgi:CHAD domain-containing protein
MAYQFEHHEPIDDGVRRIAAELIDDAIEWVEAEHADPHEVVHEVRKDCKKLRGLLRLVRKAAPALYKYENAVFRDAAASLSRVRDAEAAIETYDALIAHFADGLNVLEFAPIRAALPRHREHTLQTMDDFGQRLAAFRDDMREARARVDGWMLPEAETDPEAQWKLFDGGLRKVYRRGRKAMQQAYDTRHPEDFHEWRKRAKYLRYHLRLLRPAWPRLLKPTRSEVKALADLLGDDHDLTVLREILPRAVDMHAHAERGQLLLALMDRRSAELRDRANWLGQRIYAESPKQLTARLGTYWSVWRREHAAAGGLPGGTGLAGGH